MISHTFSMKDGSLDSLERLRDVQIGPEERASLQRPKRWDLADLRPRTPEKILCVPSIDPAELQPYGDAFLAASHENCFIPVGAKGFNGHRRPIPREQGLCLGRTIPTGVLDISHLLDTEGIVRP